MKNSSNGDGPSCRFKVLHSLNLFYLTCKKFFKRASSLADTKVKIQKILAQDQELDSNSKMILSNSVKFIDKTVDDILIPRSDIFAVKDTTTIEEINQALLRRFHTRILVYKENLDNIVGFIHIKDLYKNFIFGQQTQISKILREPIVTVTSTKLIHLLALMQKRHIHLAVVVDEYGGTAGIATNEDVIEALFGDIHDEHDQNKQDYELISAGVLIANARMRLAKVEELLHINLQDYEQECDTVGGIVIAKAGKMPSPGSVLQINDHIKIEVLDADKRALKKVRITVLDKANA